MALQKVLIIGATGNIGSSLLHQLLALPSPPPIRVSSRDPSKAHFPPNVEVVRGDLTDPTTYPALFHSVSHVFMYVSPLAPLPALLSSCVSAGVSNIVLVSSSAASTHPTSPIGKVHLAFETAIQESGISYTFLRPGMFSSNTIIWWRNVMKETGKLFLTIPEGQFAYISEQDIAAVAVIAITTDRLKSQVVQLSGPENISQKRQFEAIERLREREGKSKVELVVLEPEEWKNSMKKYMYTEFDPTFLDNMISWWKETESQPWEVFSAEEYTGKKGQTFDAWLEVHKQEFLW